MEILCYKLEKEQKRNFLKNCKMEEKKKFNWVKLFIEIAKVVISFIAGAKIG